MIGLMILGVVFIYILLAKFIINRVYKIYKTQKAKNIALAIMILVPTWDIILGYPIYKYLCWTNAGVHIYKTVDNVEGFYVGQYTRVPILLPYKDYRYVDYKKDNKFYKNSWLDNNVSSKCISYVGAWNYDYTEFFKQGKCIVIKEIMKSEISQWEYNQNQITKKLIIPIVNIYEDRTVIRDRKTNKTIAENIKYVLDNNWFMGFIQNITSSKGSWSSCGNNENLEILRETLKTKKEEI